jgi:hypothetical protein
VAHRLGRCPRSGDAHHDWKLLFWQRSTKDFQSTYISMCERQYFDEQETDWQTLHPKFGFDPCLKESRVGHLGRYPCDTIRCSSRHAPRRRNSTASGAGLRQIPNAALALWLDPATETAEPGSILRANSQ